MTRDSSFVVRRWSFVYLLGALFLSGVWGFSDRRSTIDPGPPVDSRAGAGDRRTVAKVGVLVIAHGGSSRWDSMVRKAVKAAKLEAPTEVALGMGMHSGEVRRFQEAVNRLERKEVSRIVVIPLLVSSTSEVYRQFEYLFGLRASAEWTDAGRPLALEVPIAMGRALDESPAVAEVLLERARALSRVPAEETVILVGHGPNEDDDNARWLATMQRLADHVKVAGGFHDVRSFTLRDDAPRMIHERAARALRDAVQEAAGKGRVLVVPLLVAEGGIEDKIPNLLSGLTFVYTGETLLPHDKIEHWIAEQATTLAQQPVASAFSEPASEVR